MNCKLRQNESRNSERSAGRRDRKLFAAKGPSLSSCLRYSASPFIRYPSVVNLCLGLDTTRLNAFPAEIEACKNACTQVGSANAGRKLTL
jgi:hypothetical protein